MAESSARAAAAAAASVETGTWRGSAVCACGQAGALTRSRKRRPADVGGWRRRRRGEAAAGRAGAAHLAQVGAAAAGRGTRSSGLRPLGGGGTASSRGARASPTRREAGAAARYATYSHNLLGRIVLGRRCFSVNFWVVKGNSQSGSRLCLFVAPEMT